MACPDVVAVLKLCGEFEGHQAASSKHDQLDLVATDYRKSKHTMNRLFGNASSSKLKPSLQDAISATDGRIDGIQVKVKKLDGELTRYRDQLKRMKGGPGKVRETGCTGLECCKG